MCSRAYINRTEISTNNHKLKIMLGNLLAFTFFVVSCVTEVTQGADPFESLFFTRLNCYQNEQPGCNEEFIDAYPDLAWSYLNLTKAETYFYLFTKENPDVPELIHKCGGKLPPNTKFNCNCRTEIFLPGFISGICNFAIYRELKNERLKCGCYNVILVDWMWGNAPDLQVAKLNMNIVAKQIAVVIRNLKEICNLTAEDFILSGHSYGAHLAGIVGQLEPVGIINGLDPSGGLHSEETPLAERLDRGDASCVQVIHTNAGQCIPWFYGLNFSCGTIDIWMNDGVNQPACVQPTIESFMKGDYINAVFSCTPAGCNHFQVLHYYKASMCPTDCEFIGVQCENVEKWKKGECRKCRTDGENCVVMGANACDCLTDRQKQNHSENNYYVKTGLVCPYCDNSWIDTNGKSCYLNQTKN